jgi:hypothetical protein
MLLGTGKILAKVRHEEEVIAAFWKPPGEWSPSELLSYGNKPSKLPILASGIHSMKLPTVRIWNSRGENLGILQVWERETRQRSFKLFGPLAWAKDPNSGKIMLLTSGRHREIARWLHGGSHECIYKVAGVSCV